MSSSFASNSSNDFVIINGEFALVSDGAQVAQNVREQLLSYLEDWFLDRTFGIPYFQLIFTKPFDLIQAESIIKQAIASTEGVESLLSFASNFDPITRTWVIRTSFETIYNTVEEVFINA